MPIYEYECTKCGELIESWQKFSDPPLTECKACHGSLKRLISQSTFHLKGTGWYVTDYASKSANTKGTVEKTQSQSSSKDSGTDTKTSDQKDSSSAGASKTEKA